MAHVMKHTKACCGHMFAHYDRKAELISNENVDRSRSHLNYNLASHQQMEQGDFVRQRCSEVKCQNRKDVNVMVSWVLTVPKDLPEECHEKFFKESYKFLSARYGEQNVVSSYVHMDEVSPHMHFAFVPVVKDRKKGHEKVSAKECVDRKELQTFHGDLQSYLERSLGREVNILNESTKNGNKSILELKRESASEKVAEAQKMADKIVFEAENDIKPIRAEFVAKKAYLDEIMSDNKNQSLDYPKTKKTLLGKTNVILPKEQYDKLVKVAKEHDRINKAHSLFAQEIKDYSSERIKKLTNQVDSLKEQLNKKDNELRQTIEQSMKQYWQLKHAQGLLKAHKIPYNPSRNLERALQNLASEKAKDKDQNLDV